MLEDPRCPDCTVGMDPGFMPDVGHNGVVIQGLWHPGDPEPRKLLGFISAGVKLDQKNCLKIVAYRCPQCGLLRLYAREPEENL